MSTKQMHTEFAQIETPNETQENKISNVMNFYPMLIFKNIEEKSNSS